MKKTAKRIALNRETLQSLENSDALQIVGARTIPCYPPTYGPSCRGTCPTEPFSRDNCA
jgi:hypothetical protein